MLYFLITFAAFGLVFFAMAIGYILQRKTIAGSCGGLGSVGIDKACDCDDPCESRQKKMAKAEAKRQMLEENRII
ncbi:Na(+)-translocating NADH-quinone reductase subunit E [Oceanisphaera profunda]|uniref:Na(+)-translocating NADH-quinone reductase subunit E n=1 Tax=Oceanisphaera profunda TaxID=1416627 RepID=A0A1Y0D7Y1_9GAMM|nr:(Na+)-NQR maturation NqrM [Oceanisphaera profunda]ART83246.1 Na(+)-translocating NADH-quinone reductase subunit E [Oceanisphaera profunda]